MKQGIARNGFAISAVLLGLVLVGNLRSQRQTPSAPPTAAPAAPQSPAATQTTAATPAVISPRAVINQYCLGCHNEKLKSGGLTLSELNLDAVHQSPEIAEKVIRKLRAGL